VQVALSVSDADALHAFVGGHPFLLQVALHALTSGTPLNDLLQEPPKRDGPFGIHLDAINSAITSVLVKSLNNLTLSELDMESLVQLVTLGVVSQVDGEFKYSCKLYESFFGHK
jgi:hypothetical protein